MRIVAWIVAVALIASSMPVHAQDRSSQSLPSAGGQSTSSPLNLIYAVSGVTDNGGGINAGTATVIHCSNASTVGESLRIVVRFFDGTVVNDVTFTVFSAHTFTASTHNTALFAEDTSMSPGVIILSGLAFIFSTTQFMFCTAMMVDAAATTPNGISLHMVRFSPVAGTSE
jgi:hypothetical protein